jgi:3',5'-cyclic AMP phosphodiesterase CpdA
MNKETTIFSKKIILRTTLPVKIMARIMPLFISLCLLMSLISCKGRGTRRGPEHLRFVLIGNTYPESPFKTLSERIREVFREINKDNPVFVIHLGDIVYGGKEWMGVKREDICSQYNQFFKYASRLNPILYTVKGEMDLYNDSSELYRLYSGREDYYSFNYGNLHFIVLDTTDDKPGKMSSEQLMWLENDLRFYRDSYIFVFTHHPIVVSKRNHSDEERGFFQEPDRLHRILNKYPIQAIFSGHWPSYSLEKRDNIIYYITGCGGFNKPDRFKKYNNYYIVDYFSGGIRITTQRIPYGSR